MVAHDGRWIHRGDFGYIYIFPSLGKMYDWNYGNLIMILMMLELLRTRILITHGIQSLSHLTPWIVMHLSLSSDAFLFCNSVMYTFYMAGSTIGHRMGMAPAQAQSRGLQEGLHVGFQQNDRDS